MKPGDANRLGDTFLIIDPHYFPILEKTYCILLVYLRGLRESRHEYVLTLYTVCMFEMAVT